MDLRSSVRPLHANIRIVTITEAAIVDSRCTRQTSRCSLANAKVGSWPASHCLDSTAGVGAKDTEGVDMTRQISGSIGVEGIL